MREENLSAFTEAAPFDGLVTTGNVPLIVAAENARESTINRRTRIDVHDRIGVCFPQISNAAY